jgi:hypothetical protein
MGGETHSKDDEGKLGQKVRRGTVVLLADTLEALAKLNRERCCEFAVGVLFVRVGNGRGFGLFILASFETAELGLDTLALRRVEPSLVPIDTRLCSRSSTNDLSCQLLLDDSSAD